MPFDSAQFRAFAESWGASPRYPQYNGQAECMVGVVKALLNKAAEDGKEPYIALLEYRNTPISGLPYSPAQMAMSRMLRSRLPVTHKALKPVVVDAKPHLQSRLQSRQALQKHFYDRGTKTLVPLKAGDVVRYKRGKVWQPAIIKHEADLPRSYIIQHESGELQRNCRHLRKSAEQPPLLNMTQPDDPPEPDTPGPPSPAAAPTLSGNLPQDPVEPAKGRVHYQQLVAMFQLGAIAPPSYHSNLLKRLCCLLNNVSIKQ